MSEGTHRPSHLVPDKSTAFRRKLAEQSGSCQAKQSCKGTATRRQRPGDRRYLPSICLPRTCGTIFVGKEMLEQTPGEFDTIGMFLPGSGSHVMCQMLGDDTAAGVTACEFVLEEGPTLLFVLLLDKMLHRRAKVGEDEG